MSSHVRSAILVSLIVVYFWPLLGRSGRQPLGRRGPRTVWLRDHRASVAICIVTGCFCIANVVHGDHVLRHYLAFGAVFLASAVVVVTSLWRGASASTAPAPVAFTTSEPQRQRPGGPPPGVRGEAPGGARTAAAPPRALPGPEGDTDR